MSSLYFSLLLFKYFSIILGDVRVNGGRHGNIEEKTKKNFFLYIVDLGTIMGFFR